MTRNTIVLALIVVGAALTVGAFAQDGPVPGRGPGKGQGGGGEGRGGPGMRPPRVDLFERHDENKDGKLTLEELTGQARKLIADADTDADGAVTKEEMKAFHEKKRAERPEGENAEPRGRGGRRGGPGGEGGQRATPEDLFKKIDQDGDGMISLEEFKSAHENRMANGRRGRGGRGGGGGGRGGGGGGGGGGEGR